MAEIRNQQDLDRWLATSPASWRQVVATRAALRILPFGYETVGSYINWPGALRSCFRAAFIAWGNSTRPEMAFYLMPVQALDIVSFDNGAIFGGVSAKDANPAADLLFRALRIAVNAPSDEGGYFPTGFRDAGHLVEGLTDDIGWLENQVLAEAASQLLSSRPLWLLGGTPFSAQSAWSEARDRLLSKMQHWRVWTDWYERRLDGNLPAFDIPGDFDGREDAQLIQQIGSNGALWDLGIKSVNTTIKEWLDEARARAAVNLPNSGLPPQDPTATTYGINEEGRVDRLPSANQSKLRDVQDQRHIYSDIRVLAHELASEGQRLGGPLQRALSRFNASLPERFDTADAYPIWRDGNALRRLYRSHRAVATGLDYDAARLDPIIAEELGQLLDLYNLFAFTDDGLRTRDEATTPPQERAAADEEALIGRLIDAAIIETPEIAAEAVVDDVRAITQDASLVLEDPYAAQTLHQSNRVRRNVVAALLAGAQRAVGWLGKGANGSSQNVRSGIEQAVGASVFSDVMGITHIYSPIIKWVQIHAAELTHYIATAFPTFQLKQLIEAVLRLGPF